MDFAQRKPCGHSTARKIYGLRVIATPSRLVDPSASGGLGEAVTLRSLCNCPDAWKVHSLSTQLTEADKRHCYLISLPRGGFFFFFHLRTLRSDGHTRKSDALLRLTDVTTATTCAMSLCYLKKATYFYRRALRLAQVALKRARFMYTRT